MPQSLVQIYVHLVFSTKNRIPFLQDRIIREDLHRKLGGTCKRLNCPVLRVGGVEDHVHILLRLSPTAALSDVLRELKRTSSVWVKGESEELTKFQWQNGYGAFSVSPLQVEQVMEYIRNQEAHHRKESFQEEFRRLCRENGIPLDERYAWD